MRDVTTDHASQYTEESDVNVVGRPPGYEATENGHKGRRAVYPITDDRFRTIPDF